MVSDTQDSLPTPVTVTQLQVTAVPRWSTAGLSHQCQTVGCRCPGGLKKILHEGPDPTSPGRRAFLNFPGYVTRDKQSRGSLCTKWQSEGASIWSLSCWDPQGEVTVLLLCS
jgi:hypothetical protein